MSDNSIQEIIDFINSKHDEIPGPVKFVVKRKSKKIENLDPNYFPEYFRSVLCKN